MTRTTLRSSRQPARRASGFTLIELMLVVVIMTIASAIAAPRYASFMAQSRLDAAARKIAADLNHASAQAKHRSTAQKVTFNVAQHSYALDGLNSLTRRSEAHGVELDEEPYAVTVVSADFGGDAVLNYDGYGEPDSNGTIVLAAGTHQRTITVSNTSFSMIAIEAQ